MQKIIISAFFLHFSAHTDIFCQFDALSLQKIKKKGENVR